MEIPVDKYICWLNVAVDNTFQMHMLNCFSHLTAPGYPLLKRRGSVIQFGKVFIDCFICRTFKV